MKLTIKRDELLKPLQLVVGAVERRQTLPILSNVLINIKDNLLSIIATDMEIELIGRTILQEPVSEKCEITVPARKLVDICRAIPADSDITISFEKKSRRFAVKSGKSRFTLATLPADEFPNVEENQFGVMTFSLPQKELRFLIEKTHFAMAQQDVRYFLNGMLIELKQGLIRLVATDGHRLSSVFSNNVTMPSDKNLQIIVPRKGILELMRLLKDDLEDEIKISVGTNHICAATQDFVLTSKLIEGKFPNYNLVIPRDGDKEILLNREMLKQALTRVSILSNETYRGIRLFLTSDILRLNANNPEQEEAEEEIQINYTGADLEIGFNVSYFLDVCNVVNDDEIKLTFSDSNGGILLEEITSDNIHYVVMPMRI